MDKNEAASVIQRFLTCRDTCRDECYGYCETCRYNTEYDETTEALKLAIEALGKDTNVPTNSALDHIHNVVAEREYQRGYEQGKKDAKVEAIPVDWIESYLSDCAEWSIAYYVIKQMLYKWREEQNNGQTG